MSDKPVSKGAKRETYPCKGCGYPVIRSACKYGDPFCPCQDGDMCHYEGPSPMPVPPPSVRLLLKIRECAQEIYTYSFAERLLKGGEAIPNIERILTRFFNDWSAMPGEAEAAISKAEYSEEYCDDCGAKLVPDSGQGEGENTR